MWLIRVSHCVVYTVSSLGLMRDTSRFNHTGLGHGLNLNVNHVESRPLSVFEQVLRAYYEIGYYGSSVCVGAFIFAKPRPSVLSLTHTRVLPAPFFKPIPSIYKQNNTVELCFATTE